MVKNYNVVNIIIFLIGNLGIAFIMYLVLAIGSVFGSFNLDSSGFGFLILVVFADVVYTIALMVFSCIALPIRNTNTSTNGGNVEMGRTAV